MAKSDDLAQKIEHEETRIQLNELNTFLYRPSDQQKWEGKQLATLLKNLPKNSNTHSTSRGGVPPLYNSVA